MLLVFAGIGMIGMWITGAGLGENVGGFTIFVVGLLIGSVGVLCAWTAGCLLTGYAELIENSEAIRHNTEDAQYSLDNLRRMAEEYRRGKRGRQQEEA